MMGENSKKYMSDNLGVDTDVWDGNVLIGEGTFQMRFRVC